MMKNPTAQALKSIRNLEDLVRFLRDELDWPVQVEEFDLEDAFFEFDPSELGIAEEHATKIRAIRRLRPLPNLPFGIHFVDFEEGPLPVVALRRVLNAVVKKKKARGDIATFEMDDLLFVSSHGQDDSRSITFANFTARPDGRLPVLKVLGWDEDDPKLALEHTAKTLLNCLRWPDESNDPDAWRDLWRSAFTRQYRETIRDSKRLAKELAILASKIRDALRKALSIESEDGPLRQILSAFQTTLLDDLDDDQFSDMYAQTIAYGLLSARITDPEGRGAGQLAEAMPSTNPFLKELMQTFLEAGASSAGGLDFDELGIDDVVSLLNSCDMPAVVRDFGHKNPQEDPVIHFFEGFLQEYDSQIRKDRGVFYTPRPVVSFIVRSVDELLRTEFGLEDGLADTTTWGEMAGRIDDLEIPEGATPDQAFVQILDPATGTGTFLVEVIDLIHKTMTAKWQAEGHGKKKIEKLWNEYVPEHLLPRLHGYELMMAPYAIAHMKIGLKLYETGYRFGSDERARIYLTNALEPAQDFSGTLDFAIPALAHEAEAVNAIKRDRRFTVVIGNPPYSLLSSNLGKQQRESVEIYKFIDGERIVERGALQFEKNIQDDYVKFIRLSECCIENSNFGLVGLISNHAFIDNTTFRGMRWHLSHTFSSIRVLDLLGNANRGLKGGDQNVFDIQQGVAITLYLRKGTPLGACSVAHSDARGARARKYRLLLEETILSLHSKQFSPASPMFFFVPPAEYEAEFLQGIPVNELFEQQSAGIITARDHLVIDVDRDSLSDRIQRFVGSSLGDDELLAEFGVSKKKGWDVEKARGALPELSEVDDFIRPIAYRPLDVRWVFYHSSLVWGQARPTMQHFLGGDNWALMTTRKVEAGSFAHVAVVSTLAECHSVSMKEVNYVMPVFRYEETGIFGASETARVSNLCAEAVARLTSVFVDQANPTVEETFGYICALLHSPSYRSRYEKSLANFFPHICRPKSSGLFHQLAKLGSAIADHLLLRVDASRQKLTRVGGVEPITVEKVSYADETVWIDKAKTRGFKGVPEEVWNFHIGSYQVCEKWLTERQAKGGKNPRPGRVLTDEDIEHYQKIVVALSETIRIMAEIDEVIEAHGGWPGAFQTGGE